MYTMLHLEQERKLSYTMFAKQATSHAAKEGVLPQTPLHELEAKFWSELVGQTPPLYGADLDGSLFSPGVEDWNLNGLPDLLRTGPTRLGKRMSGINTPMLYFGGFRTSFCMHVEDIDLFSINYMHHGACKQWYAAPQRSATLVEMVAAQCYPAAHEECEHFLRHKTTLIAPDVLCANGVPLCALTQSPGEFIITLPRGYHFGFNYGLNCA